LLLGCCGRALWGIIPSVNKHFNSPTFGKLPLDQVVKKISSFMAEDSESFYRLIIGSDSHRRNIKGKDCLNLVSAIVIHRKGKGGRYFWRRQNRKKCHSIREKMYLETLTSLELAEDFVPKVNKVLNGQKNFALEIHIDVGRSGETRDMIKELVGMVNGNGYNAKTKPESYGASKVADKHT
jgi:predicted RNase H-related nuclease YkuK (DUF458 family)